MDSAGTARALGILMLLPCLLSGCDSSFCFVSTLGASPPSVTLATGGSQKFVASGTTTVACSFQSDPAASVVWSVSDPVNVSISNTPGDTFGTATCMGPTPGPVTVKATLPASANSGRELEANATLDCN